MALKYANYDPSSPLPELGPGSDFTLVANSPTDIWRKPPSTDIFNAPMVYQSLPIFSFRRARVTVSADWTTLYDQGGLLFVIFGESDQNGNRKKSWIKTGIEFYGGKPCMSVVVADRWADWSVNPLPEGANGKVTVEIDRQRTDGKLGETFRVFIVEDGQTTPVREVTSIFWNVEGVQECWVGAFAAKPTEDRMEGLEVKFAGFEIVTGEEEA